MATKIHDPFSSEGEPLWTVAGMTAGAAATVTLVTSFGLDLSPDQQNAILGFVAVLAPTVVALLARNRVTPTKNVASLRNKDGELIDGPAAPLPEGEGLAA